MHLGSLGISAAAINCKTPLPLRRQIIADLVSFCPKFKLLYGELLDVRLFIGGSSILTYISASYT